MTPLRLTFVLAALLCLPTVSLAKKGGNGRGHGASHGSSHHGHPPGQAKKGHGQGNWFHSHGHERLDIPEGHYPAPGQCRVWFPGKPPGHQPPAGSCRGVSVPPGAWLIRHPADRPDHVHVTVYDPQRPSTVTVVGEFSIGTGAFLRVVLQ